MRVTSLAAASQVSGEGPSKKKAQELAAKKALKLIKSVRAGDSVASLPTLRDALVVQPAATSSARQKDGSNKWGPYWIDALSTLLRNETKRNETWTFGR